MKKHDHEDQPDVQHVKPSRQTRLHALLFAGAAFGTTLLTLAGTIEPKNPPFKGE